MNNFPKIPKIGIAEALVGGGSTSHSPPTWLPQIYYSRYSIPGYFRLCKPNAYVIQYLRNVYFPLFVKIHQQKSCFFSKTPFSIQPTGGEGEVMRVGPGLNTIFPAGNGVGASTTPSFSSSPTLTLAYIRNAEKVLFSRSTREKFFELFCVIKRKRAGLQGGWGKK